jgi:hypothetical protein
LFNSIFFKKNIDEGLTASTVLDKNVVLKATTTIGCGPAPDERDLSYLGYRCEPMTGMKAIASIGSNESYMLEVVKPITDKLDFNAMYLQNLGGERLDQYKAGVMYEINNQISAGIAYNKLQGVQATTDISARFRFQEKEDSIAASTSLNYNYASISRQTLNGQLNGSYVDFLEVSSLIGDSNFIINALATLTGRFAIDGIFSSDTFNGSDNGTIGYVFRDVYAGTDVIFTIGSNESYTASLYRQITDKLDGKLSYTLSTNSQKSFSTIQLDYNINDKYVFGVKYTPNFSAVIQSDSLIIGFGRKF